MFIDDRGANWTEFNDYEIQMNAKRFETWEFSHASQIGLKEAVRYANKIGMDKIELYNKELSHMLRKKLSEIDHVNILDKGSELSSIVTFNINQVKLPFLEKILKENNIFYSVCNKTSALIDFSKKGIEWAIRFSPHYFNTTEEIETTSEIIANLKR